MSEPRTSRPLEIKCYGACAKHSRSLHRVLVYGKNGITRDDPWEFYYCDIPIDEDRAEGWTVEIVGETTDD